MRVTKEWLESFEKVMNFQKSQSPMTFGAQEIDECKTEARENEAWALEYYPRAAGMINDNAASA